MNRFVLTLILMLPLDVFAVGLKVGDIILQPLGCWSCRLIEEQEKSIYSHMGLVVATKPEVLIAEALDSVHTISLKEFSARTEAGQKLSVRRLRKKDVVYYLQDNKHLLLKLFREEYQGLEYDQEFLWDNVNKKGQEKLYCSEMIAKLMTKFTNLEMPAKRMRYDKNRELWRQYFRGPPPDGKWGNAPADFEKSPLFYEVGKL